MIFVPDRVVTLDMDGTAYDPWGCCRAPDESYLGDEQCRHVRKDTLKRVRHMMTLKDAGLVILSYRHGCHTVTAEWCRLVGLDPSAILSPYSPDTVELLGRRHLKHRIGDQVEFKLRVCRALRSGGVEAVASYDDNENVVRQLRRAGFNGQRIKYLVDIPDAEFRAARRRQRKLMRRPSAEFSDHTHGQLRMEFS